MRRAAVALLLVVAACSPSADPPEPVLAPPTTRMAMPAGPLDPAVLAALAIQADTLDRSSVAATVGLAAATGDPRWVPYLVDLLRVFGGAPFEADLRTALATLTGIDAAADQAYVAFGSWMSSNRVDPGPGYVAWKAGVYGQLHPEFATLLTSIDDPVLAARLQWGGVGFAGIPELNDPEVVADTDVSYPVPDELVMGAVHEGVARAYPLRILAFHEMANDVLAGEPVTLAYCPLCRSGVLYRRTVDGRVLDFVTSGLLLDSNKMMVDLQTRSLWQQLTGVALAGPLEGTTLERIPLTTTTWQAWFGEHPDTDILAIPESSGPRGVQGGYSYEPGDAYSGYNASDLVWFPNAGDGRLPDKTLVATAIVESIPLAIDVATLADAEPTAIAVGDETVVAVPTASGGARMYLGDPGSRDLETASATEQTLAFPDGTSLPRLASSEAFWFAWSGTYPDTVVWTR